MLRSAISEDESPIHGLHASFVTYKRDRPKPNLTSISDMNKNQTYGKYCCRLSILPCGISFSKSNRLKKILETAPLLVLTEYTTEEVDINKA
ncbi:hypothetical protein CHS0354_019273, partial [Potamilus streckersoni]